MPPHIFHFLRRRWGIFAGALILTLGLLSWHPAVDRLVAQTLSAPNETSAGGVSVQGNRILDAGGEPIQLRGVNWFGFETQNYVVHGLWARNWQEMIAQMKSLGFNAVRLPFCPTTLQGAAVSSIDYSRNPDLQGLNSLQILDLVVAELDAQGFYILLDHHRSDCNAISELWYTGSYSEQQWIDDLVFVAERYAALPHFLGIDLKNEPHGAATWGVGNQSTDWNSAAERAAAAILAANPDILIFVEGIGENPVCSGNVNHWWGGNLEPVACYPLDIPAEKLVLSPHVYGPDVYVQSYFNDAGFPDNMPAIWEAHFGRFADQYPVVIGEYGGRYGHGGDPRDRVWQDALVDYLIDKDMHSSFYWSWNPNSGDTGGILQDDWTSVWTDKVALLQRLWGAPAPDPTATPTVTPTGDTPTPTNTPTSTSTSTSTPVPDGVVCAVTYTIDDDWGHGFTARIGIANHSGAPIDGWTLHWQFPGNQQIYNLWSGTVNQSGPDVTVQNATWNGAIPSGGAVDFGFNATYSGTNALPDAFTLNGVLCNAPAPDDPTPTPPATSTTAATTATATSTATSTPTATLTPTATPTPVPGDTGCAVNYFIRDDWGQGFVADITLTNASDSKWIGWTVIWTFDGNQQIVNLWNGVVNQSGAAVQVVNADWNGTVPAGDSVQFGFQASYSGSNQPPGSITVNGGDCAASGQTSSSFQDDLDASIFLPAVQR